MVITAFPLGARSHARCWGTKMKGTQSCLWEAYRLALGHLLRGENWCVEVCIVLREGMKMWLIDGEGTSQMIGKWTSYAGSNNWWIQESLNYEAVLHFITS